MHSQSVTSNGGRARTKTKQYVTTGIDRLNSHLQGGISAGSLVELYGLSRTGKTQWCRQLAVTSQLPNEEGDLSGKVIWIDTEDSFSPLLLRLMAKRFDLDPDSVLSNIEVIIMSLTAILSFRIS